MDIGVNLIESYLRLTGYLTFSEFEVQRRAADGTYLTITDVDIVALRLPGEIYLGDPHGDDGVLLLLEDPVLQLKDDLVDVIVGEVKEGEAEFNPGLKDHRVLHTVLRRLSWLYAEPMLGVVEELQRKGVSYSTARGGGRVRTRLVAFGRSPSSGLNTIALGHVVETMLGFFERYEDAFRPVHFKEPAPGLLRLLLKSGFRVDRPPGGQLS